MSDENAKAEALILRSLAESKDGLLLHTIYLKYKFKISFLFQCAKNLSESGLISMDEYKLVITEKGIQEAAKTRKLRSTIPRHINGIPKKFLAPQLPVNDFFLPKLDETN